MSDLKRYQITTKTIRSMGESWDESQMTESNYGGYVKYDDVIQRIAELEQRNNELAATVERLKKACNENIMDWVTCGMSVNNRLQEQWAIDILSELRQALKAAPRQNLNAVKLEAYADGYYDGETDCHSFDFDSSDECEEMALLKADAIANQRYPDKD